MNSLERMKAGRLYDPNPPEIKKGQKDCMMKMYAYNATTCKEGEKRRALLKEMLAECGEGNWIEPPFYANWGGAHLHFGSHIYANFNLTLVDDADIYVGDHTMFGPGCILATANHPINPELRAKDYQYVKPIHIGSNVWLGAGVIVCPGVTIGDNTVIGAGAVVTKDIPTDVVAVGSPARVIRKIGGHDHDYFYRDEKIDWENL